MKQNQFCRAGGRLAFAAFFAAFTAAMPAFAQDADTTSGDTGTATGDAGTTTGTDTSAVTTNYWAYTPDSSFSYSAVGKITDGQWTLIVRALNTTTGTLSLPWNETVKSKDNSTTYKSYTWQEPEDSAKKGICDLRSPLALTNTVDGTVIPINSVELGQTFMRSTDLVEFYCDIISSLGSSANFQHCTSMTTIAIGGTAKSCSDLLLNRTKALQSVEFNFPNMLKLGNGHFPIGIIYNSSLKFDITGLASPGVTNIAYNIIQTDTGSNNGSCLYGDLVLTNIMNMVYGAFQNSSLTSVSLAGPITVLNGNTFSGSSITNVVLDLPNLTTAWSVNDNNMQVSAFNGQSKIRTVHLKTRLLDMGQITNIVASANMTGTISPENLLIYVSRRSWAPSMAEKYDADSNQTGFFSYLTAAERQATKNDPVLSRAFGVLVTPSGTRKAYFVHEPLEGDKPHGLILNVGSAY